MKAAPMIRNLVGIASGLIVLGVVVAQGLYGPDAAHGVLWGGIVMMSSFLFGGWTLRNFGGSGQSVGASALTVLKLPLLCMVLWKSFQYFDPVSVIAGGSVVMLSIVLSAVFDVARPVEKEA